MNSRSDWGLMSRASVMMTAGFLDFCLCCVFGGWNVRGGFFTHASGTQSGWTVERTEPGWASLSLSLCDLGMWVPSKLGGLRVVRLFMCQLASPRVSVPRS